MKKILSLIFALLLIAQPALAVNLEADYMEYSSDVNAQAAYVTNASAGAYGNTGGTITTDGNYKVHTFLLADTGTNFTAGKAGNVAVLVIAGGGGGGRNYGGGGGGGGVQSNGSFAVNAQAYTVTVGDGGAGATSYDGTNGGNSIFSTITSSGGGGGGGQGNPGINGGCGGGGSYDGGGSQVRASGSQGGNGGKGLYGATDGTGGGGGGGGNGVDGATGQSGAGGTGSTSTIYDGSTKYYSGGGGGGATATGAVRGTGTNGGGNGGDLVTYNGASGTDDTGSGGGGSSTFGAGVGGDGGSGIVIIRCLTADFTADPALQSYTEGTIKTQGTYSLKGVAAITASLNKTLTRTIQSPIDLSAKHFMKFDMRASRIGANIKIGIHDSGGTTTEITPTIASADTFQTVIFDLSGVSAANKDAIDSIIITITNADAANTFYIDNMFGATSKVVTIN